VIRAVKRSTSFRLEEAAFMLRLREMGFGGATTSLRAAVVTMLLRTRARPMKQPRPSVPFKIK
jgi:hypothetical protein